MRSEASGMEAWGISDYSWAGGGVVHDPVLSTHTLAHCFEKRSANAGSAAMASAASLAIACQEPG